MHVLMNISLLLEECVQNTLSTLTPIAEGFFCFVQFNKVHAMPLDAEFLMI